MMKRWWEIGKKNWETYSYLYVALLQTCSTRADILFNYTGCEQAGLFSAVVTAFSVESYSWLKQDPADRSLEVLERISLQLSSPSANTVLVNSTAPAISSSQFEARAVDVAINALWFLSLTLALMASLFAILAQQWIRQYADLSAISGSERARIRQIRFESLDRWFVPQIILCLAVLLQASLFIFFAGLITLLWTANSLVAIAVTSTVALFLVIFLATTVIPIFIANCPYKSPLAWGFRVLAYLTVSLVVKLSNCKFA